MLVAEHKLLSELDLFLNEYEVTRNSKWLGQACMELAPFDAAETKESYIELSSYLEYPPLGERIKANQALTAIWQLAVNGPFPLELRQKIGHLAELTQQFI